MGDPYTRTEKRCSVCHVEKPLSEFHRLHSEPDGHMCRCKECSRKKNAKYYRNNLSKVRAQSAQWKKDHPEQARALALKYRHADPEKFNARGRNRYHADKRRAKDIALRSKYGISIDRYEEMLEEQDDKCAVCHRDRKLHVDHNHETGEVRGLLCHQCNSALGMLGESPRHCLNLIAYINRYAGDE